MVGQINTGRAEEGEVGSAGLGEKDKVLEEEIGQEMEDKVHFQEGLTQFM